MKREYQGDEYFSHNKKPKSGTFGEAIPPGSYQFRLLVSSKSAGGVIGKKGENIKRLRSQYDAQVGVPDSSAPERIINIVARCEKIVPLFEDLLPRLEDTNHIGKREVRLLVHQSQAGALIGRGGSKIKELRETSGSNLKIYQNPAPQSTDRVCIISGEDSNIVDAVRLIIDQLQAVEIKGGSAKYNTNNYVSHFAAEYGGFPSNENQEGALYGQADFDPHIMRGGTSGTTYGGMTMQQIPPPLTPNYGLQSPPGQLMTNQLYDGRPGNHGHAGFCRMDQEKQTDQVTIPANLGGAIIGKNGTRIKMIRDESGASIIVEPLSEKDQRVITITGTTRQIQHAQYLLQKAVRSSTEGQRYYPEVDYP